MADRYLLESGSPDGYQLEDASGVLILESPEAAPQVAVALPESPRAVSRTVAVQAQSWMRSVLLPLIHDATAIFRTPLVATRFVPRFVQQPTFAANILLTTLAVVAPFTPANATQLDPIPRISSHAAVLPAAPARFDLDTLAQNPFVQHDWQNPRGPKPVTPGFAQGLDLDTLALNPFTPTVENPLPRRPATLQPDNILNLFGSTLEPGPPPEPPFYQTDWPNPVLRIRAVVPLHHRYAGEPVAAPAQDPFAQRDWPNPVRMPHIQQMEIQPVFDRSVVAATPPFTQTDWPNPQVRTGIYRQQVAARSYEVMPFAQYEWPNPLPRPRYREVGVTVSLPYAEFIIVPPTPHNVSDWPNPIRRVLPTEWGSQAPLNYDAFVNAPPPPEPEPAVILIGGDDAPRKKKKTRKERHELFRDIEATVHELLHPAPDVAKEEAAPSPLATGTAIQLVDELAVLAEGQHQLIQRAAALRAELAHLEAVRREQEDEDEFLMFL